MRVPFSLIHLTSRDAAVRRDAEIFLLQSGTRLIKVLGLLHGEHGLALGDAVLDIVLDGEMPPSSWPISEVIYAPASSDPDIRCRTAVLRAALAGLLDPIDAAEAGSAPDADDLSPAGSRDPVCYRTARAGSAGAWRTIRRRHP